MRSLKSDISREQMNDLFNPGDLQVEIAWCNLPMRVSLPIGNLYRKHYAEMIETCGSPGIRLKAYGTAFGMPQHAESRISRCEFWIQVSPFLRRIGVLPTL